jgi:glycosyltransferase involved in cell wall biosynthesis
MNDRPLDTMRVTLVVPCFNEAARLDRAAFEQALVTTGWLDFCFVDDGSTDGTGALLASIAAAHPRRVQVLTLSHNAGKAEAVRRGLLHAATTSPLVGFWDADLATPLSECERLRDTFAQAPQADWIFGIRLRSLGRTVERRALRHYLGRVFVTATSLTLDVSAYDTQCGAKLFRVTPLLLAVLSEPFRSRWIFDVEMLVRAAALLGERTAPLDQLVYEQPLARWAHQGGSKVRPTDFLKALRDLVRLRVDRRRWEERRATLGPLTSWEPPASSESAA